MTLEEIFKMQEQGDIITQLKSGRNVDLPDVEDAQKALNPKLHDIHDLLKRPDKKVKVDVEQDGYKVIETGNKDTTYRIEKVARIALAIQKLIIKRAVSFCFGNEPEYNCTPVGDAQEGIYKALRLILKGVKSRSVNRKIAYSIFGYKECAEYWYPVASKHDKYGFPAEYKIRCAVFGPEFGDTLYPYFDEMGDMIAFSRAYSRKGADNKQIDYFETFTDTERWLWVKGNNGYEVVEGYPEKIIIGKIPIAYGHQTYYETEDVDDLISRLEFLLSNFADTNDYHASPKIFTTGTINGWSKKGESGAVIEGEEGSTMQYVSWANAPESVKLEIDTLLKLIYTITQTPDISFDAIKGIGAISGIALKLLFMDAHLKVQGKAEIFDDFLQRRVNIILAYIGVLNTKWAEECKMLDIEPRLVPYMLEDEMQELEYWLTANGNKPVISQEESIEKAGISNNVESTLQKLKDQQARENSFIIGEPHLETE